MNFKINFFPTVYKFRWQCDKYKENFENLIIKCPFFFFRFVIKCLIPHCERQLRLLHEIVSNRKTRSLFSGAKRWFGQPKPGAIFSPVKIKKKLKWRNLQGHRKLIHFRLKISWLNDILVKSQFLGFWQYEILCREIWYKL